MIVYEEAEKDVHNILRAMQDTHHQDLPVDMRVGILMVSNIGKNGEILPKSPLKKDGKPAFAKIKVVALKDRIHKGTDVEIHIDREAWKMAPLPVRNAVLDHELNHLVPQDERDDLGRPKLKCRKDDFACWGFYVIIQRHGINAPELQVFRDLEKHVRELVPTHTAPELSAIVLAVQDLRDQVERLPASTPATEASIAASKLLDSLKTFVGWPVHQVWPCCEEPCRCGRGCTKVQV